MLSTPYNVVMKTDAFELCEYRRGTKGSIVINPPEAGHTSLGIIDYGEGRSFVKCALDNAPEGIGVYVINHLGCTYARRNETYDDMALQVISAIQGARIISGGNVHLVGLCQGGALATAVTALRGKEEGVSILTIAGAPIDVRACESDLEEAIAMGMDKYKWMVDYGWTLFTNGRMSGKDMLTCWKSSSKKSHYYDRYVKMMKGDFSGERLYKWYDKTQDIAGPAYLFMIEKIFKENLLIQSKLPLLGRICDLRDITQVVNVVTGDKDTISPTLHTTALLDKIASKEKQTYLTEGGHLATFNGAQGLLEVYPEIFSQQF